MRTSYGVGRYRASEGDTICLPHGNIGATKRGVIFCHGNGQSGTLPVERTLIGQRPIVVAMANDGRAVIAADNGGLTPWANDTAMAAVTDAKTRLQSAAVGAPAGSVHLVGVSMGFAVACAWARANLTSVASLTGIIPVCDIEDIRANNRAGLAGVINGAYGGAYSNVTHGPTKNPVLFGSQLVGKPIRIWNGDSDTVCTPATSNAFVAASGATQIIMAGQGHTEEACAVPSLATLLAHLAAAD